MKYDSIKNSKSSDLSEFNVSRWYVDGKKWRSASIKESVSDQMVNHYFYHRNQRFRCTKSTGKYVYAGDHQFKRGQCKFLMDQYKHRTLREFVLHIKDKMNPVRVDTSECNKPMPSFGHWAECIYIFMPCGTVYSYLWDSD